MWSTFLVSLVVPKVSHYLESLKGAKWTYAIKNIGSLHHRRWHIFQKGWKAGVREYAYRIGLVKWDLPRLSSGNEWLHIMQGVTYLVWAYALSIERWTLVLRDTQINKSSTRDLRMASWISVKPSHHWVRSTSITFLPGHLFFLLNDSSGDRWLSILKPLHYYENLQYEGVDKIIIESINPKVLCLSCVAVYISKSSINTNKKDLRILIVWLRETSVAVWNRRVYRGKLTTATFSPDYHVEQKSVWIQSHGRCCWIRKKEVNRVFSFAFVTSAHTVVDRNGYKLW